jgi:hypothetical protein
VFRASTLSVIPLALIGHFEDTFHRIASHRIASSPANKHVLAVEATYQSSAMRNPLHRL